MMLATLLAQAWRLSENLNEWARYVLSYSSIMQRVLARVKTIGHTLWCNPLRTLHDRAHGAYILVQFLVLLVLG